jgi:hypothetical protein
VCGFFSHSAYVETSESWLSIHGSQMRLLRSFVFTGIARFLSSRGGSSAVSGPAHPSIDFTRTESLLRRRSPSEATGGFSVGKDDDLPPGGYVTSHHTQQLQHQRGATPNITPTSWAMPPGEPGSAFKGLAATSTRDKAGGACRSSQKPLVAIQKGNHSTSITTSITSWVGGVTGKRRATYLRQLEIHFVAEMRQNGSTK